jgi:hypothetical protein
MSASCLPRASLYTREVLIHFVGRKFNYFRSNAQIRKGVEIS